MSRIAVRALYVRSLGLVTALACGSWLLQHDALVGPDGIAPLSPWLAAVAREHGHAAYWKAPTLLWWAPEWTGAPGWVGLGAGLLLALGAPLEGPLLLVAWASYLSLSIAGQQFLRFQWDTLLLESLVCATFVARWDPRRVTEPPAFGWWAQWVAVLPPVFLRGPGQARVRRSSRAPTSPRSDVHFSRSRCPTRCRAPSTTCPGWLHAAGVATVTLLLVDLPLAFLIPFGRRPRVVLAASFVVLMVLLAVSGNYGFFQLLSIALALPLLDDGHLPVALVRRLAPPTPPTPARPWAAPVALVWALFGGLAGPCATTDRRGRTPRSGGSRRCAAPTRTACSPR